MRVESQIASRPSPRRGADPALLWVFLFTALSALVTQPFWTLHGSHEPDSPAQVARPTQISLPVLRVAADRTLTLDGKDVRPADLVERIQTLLDDRDDRIVYFEADDATRYGYAARIMRQIERAGAKPLPHLSDSQ